MTFPFSPPPAFSAPFRLLRYEEDWPARPADGASVLERVKHLPLGGGAYLSLGGEARFTYEFVDNANYGAGPQDGDGYLLQRYHLHADLHLSPAFRFFGELKSGLEDGRTGGPRPIDEDVLDLHQMFGDVRGEWDDGSATLRPGRQELSFGSGRLITVRQGPNVRLSFDAIRGIVQHRELRVDVFAARPVETDRDAFDNSAEADYWVWGVYGTARTPAGQWDVYYLGSDRPNVVYARGRGGETRHTVGSRLSGRRGSWDYNVEAAVQGGDFEGTSIFAWMVSSESGVTLETAVPVRAGLKADAYSGDGGRPRERAFAGHVQCAVCQGGLLRRSRGHRCVECAACRPVAGCVPHADVGADRG